MNVLHASDLKSIFANEFPKNLEIAILHALDAAYRDTRDHLVRFRYPEARDLRGHYVRACFEGRLSRLASDCPNVLVESRLNKRKSYYHTRVKVGRLSLTASAVRQQNERPRKALFRSTYASDGQLSILEQQTEISEDTGESIYGILCYGPSSTPFPLFATIACPDANENKYIHITDLIAKHPNVIDLSGLSSEEYQEEPIPEIFISPNEDIQEPEIPDLRPAPKREGEGSL